MGAISFDKDAGWVRANWVFDLLMDDLLVIVDDEKLKYEIEKAKALNGLHLHLKDKQTAKILLEELIRLASRIIAGEITPALKIKGLESDDVEKYKNSLKELVDLMKQYEHQFN